MPIARASRVAEIKSPHFSVEKYRALWRDESRCQSWRFDPPRHGACDGRLRIVRDEPKLWAAKEVGGRTEAILGRNGGGFSRKAGSSSSCAIP